MQLLKLNRPNMYTTMPRYYLVVSDRSVVVIALPSIQYYYSTSSSRSPFYVALPKIWYRLQMLGPISSYCAFVWQKL